MCQAAVQVVQLEINESTKSRTLQHLPGSHLQVLKGKVASGRSGT